ncbi:hypothetical protein K435DRAFT_848127 [Dendrothele bispora CBS 962.96]|uniref:F-box domain-containing protein n=1 Tax=Dendrothele bispora (strain CBS 962.96) TaxID=1314807 RepID=A0A4S8MWK9_DENBC|nr:hypothetical protein K435DRAFT_848127 [Dendrothele bispora CBS 962.96]
MNTDLGILILPNELLIKIFKLLLPNPLDTVLSSPETDEPPVPLIVASVCRSWRQLVNAPDLWTYIRVSERHLNYLTLFLERSKPYHFDLIIPSHLFDAPDTTNKAIIEKTESHFDRVRSLVFHKISSRDFERYREILPTRSAPNLEFLHICCLSQSWMVPVEPAGSQAPIKPLLQNTDSLRSLSVRGLSSASLLPLVNLTHLEVRGYSPTRLDFQKLFSDCPGLQTLCLPAFIKVFDDENYPETEKEIKKIESTSLRSLSFGIEPDHSGHHCGCPISTLVLPNLEYLEVIGNEDIDIGTPNALGMHFLDNLSSDSFRKVSSLCLKDLEMTEGDLMFCRNLISVTNLKVDRVQCLRGLLKDGVICFPHLTSLGLWGDVNADQAELVSVINACLPRHQPSLQVELCHSLYNSSLLFNEGINIKPLRSETRPHLARFTSGYDSMDEMDDHAWSDPSDEFFDYGDEYDYDYDHDYDHDHDYEHDWDDEDFNEDFDDGYYELEDAF